MLGRIVKWYFLLNKRLFKKPSFLLILCLVPFLVGGMHLISRQESGMVRIALCRKDPGDELTAEIIESLMREEGVLRYRLCESEQEARDLVKEYQADVAWIFPENMEERLREAAAGKRPEPLVTVVESKESVSVMSVREILYNALYPFFSYAVYEDFVKEDMGIRDVSEEELKAAYEKTLVEGSLFQMAYLDGQSAKEDGSNYLETPIRGILSVWLVLCALAASMYYMQDEQEGFFLRVPVKYRLWAAFGVHAVLLSDGAVFFLAACRLTGAFTSWHKEIPRVVLFSLCILVFCNLIRLLCRTPERLGSCISVLVMGMLVLCPVFINIRKFKVVQCLLPPFYYLNSIHNPYALYGMAGYTVILFVLCVLIFRYQNRDM